ncbi:MAG: 4Fe-4S dicluster domain-containing protein [Thermodesulfobacteriota bacterium]|nr:4Fe-4S dicluster domain-containing protein [Thermodesulfobacteriota bacterium]
MFLSRGFRLALLTILAAVIFPGARFILLFVLFLTLLTKSYLSWRKEKRPYFFYLVFLLICIFMGYFYSANDIKKANEYRLTHKPIGEIMEEVADGRYEGKGEGYRGPIQVSVWVQDHRIKDIELLYYRDLAAVKATTIARLQQEILSDGVLDNITIEPDLLRGAVYTSNGFISAIQDALIKGIKDYPKATLFSRAFVNIIIGAPPDRFAINAIAIIFAVFLVLDYTVQSVLVRDTGQTLTCYNCATCVGVCPIKEAEGFQIPMDLVLAARLGDYDTVERLSKYCVGCGRCAAKCPAGNSGPGIISAAFRAKKRLKESLQKAGKAA